MSRRVTLVAVALPLLVIVLGIVRAERFLGRTRDFVFEVGGYDPRDLLRGHYLQFTLRVDPLPQREACVDDPQGTCCLCLMRAQPGQLSQVERATCATAHTECDGSLPLGVLAQPYRYYIPEESVKELQKRLLDAMPRSGTRAVVAVDSRGEARVRELRIDGVPVPGAVPR